MKIQIKKRYTNEVMFESDEGTLKELVEKNKANLSEADLSEADLSEADLYKANLYKADLSEADLYKANLYKLKIKITQKDEILKALRIEILD